MIFNEHRSLEGAHAFLSPSNYHWINYSDEALIERYQLRRAAQKGSELHAFAAQAIRLGVKLPRNQKTINSYVNDAIGYKMTPEQPLVYSVNCFGTADAISFRKGLLRIHDLKTGRLKASMNQLKVYEALFCLEYKMEPRKIESELRIYQSDEIVSETPDPEEIEELINKIVHFNNIVEHLKEE